MFTLNKRWQPVKVGWFILSAAALIFALLFLGFSLFPGAINPAASKYFPLALAEKARIYNFPPRILYIISFSLQAALLFWLLFSSKGKSLYKGIQKLGQKYWFITALSVVCVWLLERLVSLPFSYYLGFYWQKAWGFSTQSQASWWIEYLKSAGIDFILTLIGGLIFFWLVNRLSRYWWVVGAVLFSIWLLVDYLLWPIVISPLFNKFTPISDPHILNMINSLARQAGMHLSGIFVMDASKQTTLANAYFTGIGSSKRIVIYDTLLRNYSLSEIKAVIAHEMGHWRHNDVIHGLLYGMLGGVAAFGLLAFLLKPWLTKITKKPPELWAALQLALLLLLFVSNPVQNAVSRGMELRADAFSLKLTRNLPAEIKLQKDLARTSLADVSPPSFIVWFSYDHPSPVARIQALKREYSQDFPDAAGNH
jgi:STE24 endopeptidase